MVNLEFYKMSGHGNDFVVVDNWDQKVAEADMPALVKAVCHRKFGVGADGMVFVESGPEEVDFAWRFYNSDGSEADMCGNAARCVARFAYTLGIAPKDMSFLTKAGIIHAGVGPKMVKVKLMPPGPEEKEEVIDLDGRSLTFRSMKVGVPHTVAWVDDINAIDVVKDGRAVRFHPRFQPAGTNVNFAQILGKDRVAIRTYERGVEDETLACGTGSTAAVLLSALKGQVKSPCRVLTRGGDDLIIHFTRTGDTFTDVFMEGIVRITFTGRLGPDIML
ncbi:MAG: diaminopimelate epimerase [Deltaproteobacteria bacterium]|nr:diaminopimelate epimerase [Deltaproteobacteria bacterium]